MSWGCTGICVSSQKGSGGGLQRETGGKEGSLSNVASTSRSGRVPRVLARVPKREVGNAATSEQAIG